MEDVGSIVLGFLILYIAGLILVSLWRVAHNGLRGIPLPFAIVPEWRYGVVYRSGRFLRVAGTGRVWTWWRDQVLYVARDEQIIVFERREFVSSDRLPLLLSATVFFEVVDPHEAIETSQDYRAALTAETQGTLLDLIGQRPLARILDERRHFETLFVAAVAPSADARGLKINRAILTELIVHPEILMNVGLDSAPVDDIEPGQTH